MGLRRIVITRSRMEWNNNPSSFQIRPGRYVTATCRVIGVDPVTTSPNALVGISIDGDTPPIYLRPGECVTLDREVQGFWVFNPLTEMNRVTNGMATTMCGVVSLLLGGVGDLVAWNPRDSRRRASPFTAILAAGSIAGGSIWVNVDGLEKLRLLLYPLTLAGAPLAPPADLAATINVYAHLPTPLNGSGWVDGGAALYGGDTDTGLYGSAGGTSLLVLPDAASSFNATQTQLVMDYEVGAAGGVVRFDGVGVAGTGVGGLWAVAVGS